MACPTDRTMQSLAAAPTYALVIFAAIVVLLEVGRRIGERQLSLDPVGARTGIGAIEGAVFGLLALLIAFTFSGAASRLDDRRTLITEEVNAIGTAWLRLDLLPPANQPALRQLMRDYVDARIAFYQGLTDKQTAAQENARAMAAQLNIWKQTVAAVQQMPSPPLGISVLQALNEMIDITTTRSVALKTHPPLIIYLMLLALMLVSALLIGFGMAGSARRNWLHGTGYALVMVSVMYVILDFEFPRLGIIRVDQFDQIMLNQRKSMDEANAIIPTLIEPSLYRNI
ncbi:DUF4239 domain-containing protein [Pseudomonas sp. LS1212]|uniref:bestrophin-like domain n=1 Tax=Pseudomonas sp. LS1212 TaxID=2972478 RepID=UPI00215BDEB1|nr:DUF4239 domain-containing protein [Pseudomonas sp. LS1212]UVJ43708.1 DUF4239 domain-containing protein [Pseudomonas sp. LS1212]